MKMSAALFEADYLDLGIDWGLRTAILLDTTQVPFDLSMCQSVAFDETVGRVCLGLYSGDVYVVDF